MRAMTTLARRLRAAAEGAAAGAAAALVFVLLDGLGRARWGAEGPRAHVLAAGGLLMAVGAIAMGIVALLPSTPEAGAGASPRLDRRSGWAAVALVAALVAAALSGVVVRAPALGVSLTGPLRVAVPALGFVVTVAAAFASRAAARRATSARAIAAHVGLSVLGAVVLLVLDARALRGRHPGVHLAIEVFAFFLLAGAIARSARLAPWVRRAWAIVGAGALAWSIALLGSRARREGHVVTLRHLSDEPSSAGMLYARALGVLAPPRPPPPVPTVELEMERWRGGERETPEQSASLARVRATCVDCNIVVFFVDTLRADTATDPSIMPSAAAFAHASLRFPSAYSTASDTLRALSSLLTGRYDGVGESGLLRHVRARGLDNALFISTSAHDYLTAQLPDFHFDEEVTIADHADEVPVWGYGADRPTGPPLVRSALSWIRERHDRRFFAWIYNFDLHGWRQMRDEKLRPYADDPERPENRYLAVAAMVDRSFRGLLEGLDRLGIGDRTIVIFVSDHGEALGYRGFWTHSTFLWQSLVRVPLAIRVPGLEPRELSAHASLVDIAPTISRFVDPFAETVGYHGVDLLRFYVDPEADRELPLLLHASSQGRSTLYGLVAGRRKLIVASEGGPPLLHDLAEEDPDDTDLALTEPDRAASLLDQLAASPIMIQ